MTCPAGQPRPTRLRLRPLYLYLLGALASLSACGSSEQIASDAFVTEAGQTLYPCDNPGQACNAHDPCAIDPICGKDHFCRPTGVQDCDDGLTCTDDVCAGAGRCEHVPISGHCALPVTINDGDKTRTEVQCFARGTSSPDRPCAECNPDADPTKWYPSSGGACDDKDDCTKDDYCEEGKCRGTSFRDECDDKLGCTIAKCDGKGGCLGNELAPDFCLVGGACLKDQEGDETGCNICDVATNVNAWTPLSGGCTIQNKCYPAGAKHPDPQAKSCAICDPTVSTTDWTPAANQCVIDNQCYDAGDKDSGGCATCDPTISKTSWTPLPSLCEISGVCFAAGARSLDGCGICDPAKNKTDWTLTSGGCRINHTCYQAGEANPFAPACAKCDPAVDEHAWTPVGSGCFVDGQCVAAGDKDLSGCNQCVPQKSKIAWSTVPNTCLINGQCFGQGDKHRLACAVCEPGKSDSAWTVSGNYCLIDDVCYIPGARDTTNCAECNPAASKTEWTVVANMCQVDGQCYKAGDADPSGCQTCQPAIASRDFTPIAGKCNIDGKCYDAGDKHPLVCGECVPSKARKQWTVAGNYCLIDDNCYLPTVQQPGGCGLCVPSQDKYDWTPPVDRCVIDSSCFKAGEKDGSGCGVCDPTKSRDSWSKVAGCTFVPTPWAAQLEGNSSSNVAYDVAIDAGDNVYVIGYYASVLKVGNLSITSTGSYDVFVAKFSPGGKPIWLVGAGGASTDYGYGIAVDQVGNTYVTGRFATSANFGKHTVTAQGSDIFVAKLDPAGNWLWATGAGGSSTDQGFDIATDPSGGAIVGGYFRNTALFDSISLTATSSSDGFVARLSPQGKFIWATAIATTSSGALTAIDVDPAGSIYAGGYFSGTLSVDGQTASSRGSIDGYVAKFSSNGRLTWLATAGGAGVEYVYGLAVDKGGAVYASGIFSGAAQFGTQSLTPVGSNDVFAFKLNPLGKFVWATGFGSNSSDYSRGVAVDDAGQVFVSGYFQNILQYGSRSVPSIGGQDAFVARLSAAGVPQSIATGGGMGSDLAYSIAVRQGHAVAVGQYWTDATFGKTQLQSAGNNCFVWKIPGP
ncbi:MAG: SBBP repeat-containing protein [Deltaproteobacteria bacterium]|nr:SBBP repeat-containing protein [Deltaproteobacteria bacterium]